MTFKLYDYFRSSACYRVRIALNLKALAYEVIPVHLLDQGGQQFSAAYQQINPQSLVPTLQSDAHYLTQSLAIIEYLEEMYPRPPLLPSNPLDKAWVRAFALTIAADMHPLNNLRVLQYLTQSLKVDAEQKTAWYHHWLHQGLHALETQVTRYQQAGVYCFGDTPTLADICLVPQLYNARRFGCDLGAYPTLTRIDAHCQNQPAFISALPIEEKTYAEN